MNRIIAALLYVLFSEEGVCSGVITFGEEYTNCYSSLKQTFSFPSEYKMNKYIPRNTDCCSWSICIETDSGHRAIIGRLTLMPQMDLHCSVSLAFDHKGYFNSPLACLEAITQALMFQGGFLAYESFGVKVLYLRACEIYCRVIAEKEMSRIGWEAKWVSNFLGRENDAVFDYMLPLEPLSDLELLAYYLKRLKAKL